jgi:hypothetical protein
MNVITMYTNIPAMNIVFISIYIESYISPENMHRSQTRTGVDSPRLNTGRLCVEQGSQTREPHALQLCLSFAEAACPVKVLCQVKSDWQQSQVDCASKGVKVIESSPSAFLFMAIDLTCNRASKMFSALWSWNMLDWICIDRKGSKPRVTSEHLYRPW